MGVAPDDTGDTQQDTQPLPPIENDSQPDQPSDPALQTTASDDLTDSDPPANTESQSDPIPTSVPDTIAQPANPEPPQPSEPQFPSLPPLPTATALRPDTVGPWGEETDIPTRKDGADLMEGAGGEATNTGEDSLSGRRSVVLDEVADEADAKAETEEVGMGKPSNAAITATAPVSVPTMSAQPVETAPPAPPPNIIHDAPRQPVVEFTESLLDENDEELRRSLRAQEEDNGQMGDLEDEEDDPNATLAPDYPLMERVQKALKEQMLKELDKLQLDLKDKEEAVRKTIKRREEVGVELYTLQQQLARNQAMLESSQDNWGVIRNYREEAERVLKHTGSQYSEERDKLKQHEQYLDQHKQELEKISRTLKQVDLYNEDLRSKIMVAKRTTLKAEEDIVKQEVEKKRQDYFIDQLTEQLRQLQERRAMYETQLIAQQKETKAAIETLQDAATEMEAIQFEKRQLLHQWKSSLIGLQKRDEILEQIEAGIQKNKDTIINMVGEIGGFRQSLRKAQEQNETLTILLNKLEGEVAYLKRQITGINDQKEKLKESYSMYGKSLEQTEQELAQVMQERQALQLEVNAVQKLTLQTTTATQTLQTQIADHLQNQLSISKGTSATKKDNSRLRSQIHEKESIIATVQNDLSSIRLDTLNVSARLEGMRDKLRKLDAELGERNEVIEKYEVEIRRRNDELGKKQGEMDLLNKKYDALTGSTQDESVGPLEATIHNLTKLVQAKEKECTQLSHFWLRAQNELVAMSKKSQDVADETQDLRMRLTVLTRKKMVVNNAFETECKEIRDHQRNIRQLQHDMVKINTLLSRQSVVQNKLEENNLGLEVEFRAKLKEAELESVRMEHQVEDLRTEKSRALQGLIEAERQMMLWEKKIQLARETQAALDPNIGATEIKEMEAEIHRMKLRHTSLLKLQEKMISEMEKSVYRRDSIAARTKSKGKGGGQMTLQKHIADLTKRIRQTLNDLKECEQDITALQQSQETIHKQVEESHEACKELDDRERNLAMQIDAAVARKQLVMNQTLLHQRHARRYQEWKEKRYSVRLKDPDQVVAERERMKGRLGKIEEVLGIVEKDFGGTVKYALGPVRDLINNGAVQA
ncbi:Coiled-coil domain-containing protein 40 [Rhizophlyctis rosea]|uniref:Coiled-coil domain-containing protein 40 n=1 Tax=Rhizophlyctis rosea TaxID=64517 RepID=A0AAD5X4N0_9FUNG|nr:Coiled-coil domain-containing protein 40 [Rhizophlyctis rosea]